MEAARKCRIVAEKHLALTIDFPTDRREPSHRVPRRFPLLLDADLLAQECCRPTHRNEALPWHLLLGPAAPKAAAVGRVERLSFLEAPRQRIEILELGEVVDLLLEQRLLNGARCKGRNRRHEVT